MTRESKLVIGLAINSLIILLLCITLGISLDWSLLAIATTSFLTLFVLSYISIKIFKLWQTSLMDLTCYTQLLAEGVGNIAPKSSSGDGLISQLQLEIAQLAKTNHSTQSPSSLLMLSSMMDSLPIAICIFDQQWRLSYRNPAMYQQLKLPLLIGSHATDSGFRLNKDSPPLSHQYFDGNWQVECVSYHDNGQQQWLYTAINISRSLQQHESIIQQNLIRVFSHELRNSLTPMASMTDTLLCSDHLDQEQARLVLGRIHKRSSHLLEFIGRYADLSQLSEPNLAWFDIGNLIDEAATVLADSSKINIKGESQCFGDIAQLSMVFTNLFTNAQQAHAQSALTIEVVVYRQEQQQFVDVIDNGCGFANLENALTPFYSTKSNGSGIGLSLCREIIHQHGGELTVNNNSPASGAIISMNWPTTG